jgi:thiol-disulfide isomerase/thioredoxin
MFKNLFVLIIVVAAVSDSSRTLEYRFNVGEELVYELVDNEDLLEKKEESERRYETKARWKVYPIRRNEDGSWHLVVRTWVKLLRYDREQTNDGELGKWKKEPYVRLENTFIGYCDLMPDGSYEENPTLGQSYFFELLPEILFRPLPFAGQDEKPAPRIAPTSGTVYTLKEQTSTDHIIRLTGSLERPLSANYESTHTQEIVFDTAAGRVQQIVETDKSGRKDYPSHSRTTYRLVDIVKHPPEWVAKFEDATKKYFVDRDAWWEHKLQVGKARTKEACRALTRHARKRLIESQKNVSIAEVRSAYDGLITLHDREVQSDIDAAAEREELYSKPPFDWVSTNLAGDPRRRVDYIGKVVILDFWYRGCGHCILALPKIKTLHAKYKDRGVIVLGVNNDSDVDDAHHVVNTYSIPYENVRNVITEASKEGAEPTEDKDGSKRRDRRISSEYNVNAWPTLIVLDQKGRVAEVVTGNATDLVEHLSGVIDGLLAVSPGN